jgi:[acyl-carrier-protein] S-malonyltransferase
MRYAVLFPGQGSQFVGMGADVLAEREDLLGAPADDVLGWSLRDLCTSGPEEDLTSTEHSQPALYAIGYALWDELAAAAPHPPHSAAGHSLGEYTALAAAGAMSFLTGLELVAERGRAMGSAGRRQPAGMTALIGIGAEAAERAAAARRAEGGHLYVANVNAPGQVVVSGAAEDLEWVAAHGRDHGVRRAISLNVAGAFHSPFMADAADELGAALAGVAFARPAFPVFANVTAAPIEDVAATLAAQLVGTVRFAESLTAMAAAGVEAFVHVGPGHATAGMARRTVPEATVLTVSSLDEVGAVAQALAVQ